MANYCYCGETRSELRKRIIKGGAVQYVEQCQNCGETTSSPKSHTEVFNQFGTYEIAAYDDHLKESYRKSKAEAHQQSKKTEKDQFFSWYSEYLKSPEWRAKRLKVLARAKGICEGCGEVHATQVHHLTYERVGDELLFDLVAICDECHHKAHKDKDAA